MNTIFVIKDGQIETQEPVEYMNIICQQAQDSLAELGGELYDRKTAAGYIDQCWRPNVVVYNLDTMRDDVTQIPDEMWNEYREDLLREVEKLIAAGADRDHMTRAQAVVLVGAENVDKVDAVNCDATSRDMRGTGCQEWTATLTLPEESDWEFLTAVYLPRDEEFLDQNGESIEDLDNVDWKVDHYKVC